MPIVLDSRRALARQLRLEGIVDERVLAAIAHVRREMFVAPEHRQHAYKNIPLPIGDGQTISQPYVVALMTQALALCGTERVLEVGTGSGYQAALLAELAREVVSLERFESLAERASRRLFALGYTNVEVHTADGTLGWPPRAPYNGIVVTAAAPQVPPCLVEQLAEKGRLVIPVGPIASQELIVLSKEGGRCVSRSLGPVRFVPLVGKDGWAADCRDREA